MQMRKLRQREVQLISIKITNLYPVSLALELKSLITVSYCLSVFILLFKKLTAIVFVKK